MRLAINVLMTRLAVVSLMVAMAGAAGAQAPEAFFKGKTITIYIGYGPGGGYDIHARLIANHIGRHIPGNPQLVPRNVPGAGSIKVANQLYATLPKDGTALGVIGDILALKSVLGDKSIQFKADEFNWIGRSADSKPLLIVWHDSPVKTFQDAKTIAIPIGVPGAGSATTMSLTAVNNILGTKFRLISGYPGSAEIKLALQRGEVQGTGSVIWDLLKSQHQDWLDERKINIIYQVAIEKIPELPNVPGIVDLASSEEDKQLLRLFASYTVIGRSMLAPPDVPADRVLVLRQAFDAMVKDEAYKAEITSRKLDSGYMPGAKLQDFIKEISSLPSSLLDRARAASNVEIEHRQVKE